MARDSRLDLGRYIDYTKDVFAKKRQLNFDDLFTAKADSGTAPFTPNRYDATDLLRRIQARKLRFNPGLQYVGEDKEEFQVFAGIGRFNRREDYDFNTGRALTKQRPEEQPDFNPVWRDMYAVSPTLKPDDRISNPMPRASNPDPKGYLMAVAEKKAENDVEGNKSVAELLGTDSGDKKQTDDKNNKDVKA